MGRLAIALDLGTSGFRAQAIDLSSGAIISTAITLRHPLPGVNVMDHIHFALEFGMATANRMMQQAVNRVIRALGISIDQVVRLAICGNPTQVTLFQGGEIRDLAYAGRRKLESLGVTTQEREAVIIAARDLPGLQLPADCEVVIPPAVQHEVGADALALIIQSRMLDRDETSLATDFGTNAEIALFHNGRVFTGSTAAGPALEGQQITCGLLAAPGVISDLEPAGPYQRLILLDSEMLPTPGGLVDLTMCGTIDRAGSRHPIGITGTGTIAIVNQALEANLIRLPHIQTADHQLHLGEDLFLTEKDLREAGKAIGAVRAGHITLCQEAGIALNDIHVAYMSGASGTYVDASKAQKVGLIPAGVHTIYQVGNTSLAMARDLATEPKNLDKMIRLANDLKQTHCLLAASEVFKKVYILEFSYWTEGMPMSQYREFLARYRLPDLPPVNGTPSIIRLVKRDIDDLGRMGLTTIADIGDVTSRNVEGCVACLECIRQCPGNALALRAGTAPPAIVLTEALCEGVACRRCERVCPEKVFELNRFFREG